MNDGAAFIVMGVSGSGKSVVGRVLAERLGASFIEGDELHSAESRSKMRSGIALEDEDRWPWLDRIADELRAGRRRGNVVASCSALKRRYRDRLLREVGGRLTFVCLITDRSILEKRLNGRPDHFMPASLLDSQLAAFERPTSDEPAQLVDAALPVAQIVGAVVARHNLEGELG